MARVLVAATATVRRMTARARPALHALTRRRHGRRKGPALELAARPNPYARALGLLCVVLLGAWLGLLVVGDVRVPVGPMNTTMTLRPSLTGGTKINISPLGALELRSHEAPLRLDVDVDRLDPERSQALVDHPERIAGLQDEVVRDVEHGTFDLAVRSCVAVVMQQPAPWASRSTAAHAGPSPRAASRSPCSPPRERPPSPPGTPSRSWSRSTPGSSPPHPPWSATPATSSASSTSTRRSWRAW